MKLKRGIFITLEGNEGCGKSTQIKLLYDFLKRKGYPVFLTREPGGTRVGDKIREILLDRNNMRMTPICETLLYMASRSQLVSEIIKPELKKGKIVLCDRWLDATVAYQGYGGSVDVEWIESLGREATGGLKPKLSLYLDLAVRDGLKRATSHKKADRMELKTIVYHQKVRRGYLAIARKDPRRFKRIPLAASDSIAAVHQKVIKEVLGVL